MILRGLCVCAIHPLSTPGYALASLHKLARRTKLHIYILVPAHRNLMQVYSLAKRARAPGTFFVIFSGPHDAARRISLHTYIALQKMSLAGIRYIAISLFGLLLVSHAVASHCSAGQTWACSRLRKMQGSHSAENWCASTCLPRPAPMSAR